MTELLYVFVTISLLLVFYKLMKKSIFDVNYPLMSIFFLIKFFLFAYIGTIIHIVFQGYYNDIYYLNQFILSSATLILFPIGMLLATKLTSNTGNFNYHYDLDYIVSNNMFYIFVGLFLLSIIVLILFISKLEMLPIVAIIKGMGIPHAYELRSAAGNTFPGKYYRYVMFMKDLPFLLMIILFFLRNISMKWKILFFSILFFNIFVAVMDMQKAPLMKIFLILIVASLFYYKKINWKILIITIIGLGISVVLMYAFFLGHGSDFFGIIKSFLSRIFFAQIDAFIYYQKYIEANEFLYGTSFPNPKEIFPFEHVKITTEVYKFKIGNWEEGMPLGSFPTVFYGDWYCNFGYVGALFSMLLLGFIIQIIDIKMFQYLNKYRNVIILGIYIYLINYFSNYALTSYIGIAFDAHLAFPILVTLFLFLTNNYFLKKEQFGKSNINSIK